MTREEWYKHRTLDCVEQISEYVTIILDDSMDTHMCRKDAEQLRTLLIILQGDIFSQLRDLEETDD